MRQWIALVTLVACAGAQAGEVTQAVAVAALKEGRLAVDVRSQIEYDAGTVLNAVRVDPVRLVNQMKQVLTDRNTVFVIFASSDQKANKAQDQLNKAGYLSVINGGNYEELHNALYDITDDPAE
ncbi:rhodanese-like domain-containing protein [Pseudomonas sp. 21LCFQ02]|uniref:rhodanese-like domain-containing protein n=1 Tax=unclassified Pseudomonas TaxID=196821 RepID=UPI0004F84F8D|nr:MULTISPECIES: rhodanese-like domain-containing protein [unclassified Pseudomonas]MCO8160644.1 rhodanese-like domain-containing protein [Pseudomonas sp. 21LCFQ010]MCO8170132.1 rhodanese-like domain-containing protein [Pseudomonas sp. 21LCFQ02]MCQ9427446.1 rhodanese-like domain-containing protein [Pseudomonas sp. LJDD11]BAP44415.1 putative phage shock operon rhodanese PspE [Pseudomonas sp. StFLB209]